MVGDVANGNRKFAGGCRPVQKRRQRSVAPEFIFSREAHT